MVLRKAKILANRLKNAEFEAWVDSELNGYKDELAVPEYRKIAASVRGRIRCGYTIYGDAQIMTASLPEGLQRWGTTVTLTQPISSINDLAGAGAKTEIRRDWPPEMAVHYGAHGYNDSECLGAWQVMGRNSLVAVVEQVRNRVLDFSLKIEAAAPTAGDEPGFPPPISQEQITQIFHTYVIGDSNNIVTGASGVTQNSASGIRSGDLQSLLGYLSTIGIPGTEISGLKRAASQPENKSAVHEWLAKLSMAAATGAINVSLPLVAKAVAHYLGI